MKKALLVSIVGIASFATSLVVGYLLLPSVAPGLVGTPAAADSVAATPAEAIAEADTAFGSDALASDTTSGAGGTDPGVTGAGGTGAGGTDAAPLTSDSLAALEAELRRVKEERDRLSAEIGGLRRDLETVREKLDALDQIKIRAESLSATLGKLDDRQLGPILAGIDLDVLEMIYARSSARNQTKLLQAMPPERAVRFIQHVVGGSSAEGAGPAANASAPSKEL